MAKKHGKIYATDAIAHRREEAYQAFRVVAERMWRNGAREVSPKAIAEQARLEYGVRFDNSFVAGFARRLVIEYPEMAGLLRTKQTRISWEAIADDLPNIDLGKPKKGGKMDKQTAEALVETIEAALEARRQMQDRRRMRMVYGLSATSLEMDAAYNQAKKKYEEALEALTRLLGGKQ